MPVSLLEPIDGGAIILIMWRATIFSVIVAANAAACSFSPPEYNVSRSFSVHVKNDVGPVAGLKLKVSRFKWSEFEKLSDEQQRSADRNSFEEIIAESTTDDMGTAQFKLDRTGAFTLSLGAQLINWIRSN